MDSLLAGCRTAVVGDEILNAQQFMLVHRAKRRLNIIQIHKPDDAGLIGREQDSGNIVTAGMGYADRAELVTGAADCYINNG